ncbi:hypothetical protein DB346_02940 [Verrucomicrobia bacterium LW23]|nr:hypothetical protein DB346_03715 [Verrucomicrobia bacterium LW23]PTY04405.1 hypothetical protein DB346_02940 [Verrucomicrobia bacterium LW23]
MKGLPPTGQKLMGELSECAPGKFVQVGHGQAPKIIICDVVGNNDGTCRMVPRNFEKFQSLTDELLEAMGNVSRETLMRLIMGGFIEGIKVSPRVWLINLQSWFNHLDRCAADPEFWNDKRVRHYNSSWKNSGPGEHTRAKARAGGKSRADR